jgi:magnesium transporter
LLITFQEREGDCLDPVRRRIRDGGGQVRTAPADYLAYCVLDAVVDAYYPLLEAVGDTVEELERSIVERPGPESVVAVRELKKDLLIARKAVWPLREALHTLIRDPLPRISDETRVYLRDCLDHCAQIIDMIETDRELVTGLMDIYMSSVSNRMNEIMKVLTIFAAIFIPLTFIAGIYGMNFNPDASPWNMPELKARYGYPLALGIMASTALIMLLYFRRKKWIGR